MRDRREGKVEVLLTREQLALLREIEHFEASGAAIRIVPAGKHHAP